ncbi:hypothetical protein SBY92_002871 [Candida maltosa Xu316]
MSYPYSYFAAPSAPVAPQEGLDVASLFDLLHQHQFFYKENTRPRVIKRLETEDEFQIYIQKSAGNFNNYEIKVIKGVSPMVQVVIYSIEDNFETSIPQQNVLVLNIPKRIHYIHSSVQDIINCLLGHEDETEAERDEHLENSLADHEKLITAATQALKEQEPGVPSAEKDAKLENTLGDHEKLIRAALEALNNPQQQPYSDKQVKQDFESKSKATAAAAKAAQAGKKREEFAKVKKILDAQKKARQDYDDKVKRDDHERLVAHAANVLKQATQPTDKTAKKEAQVAGTEAAEEAKKKEEIEKTKKIIAAQRQAALDKIAQAQKELEELTQKENEALKLHEVAKQQQLEEEKKKVEFGKAQAEEKAKSEKEEYDQFVKQQQEFLNQFFGFNLGPVIPNTTKEAVKEKQKPKVAPKPKQLKVQPKATPMSNGHSHKAVLEDVEDEESVMFKKRFGH